MEVLPPEKATKRKGKAGKTAKATGPLAAGDTAAAPGDPSFEHEPREITKRRKRGMDPDVEQLDNAKKRLQLLKKWAPRPSFGLVLEFRRLS